VDSDRLQQLPLFRELTQREVERVARWADEVDVPVGKHLMDQGAFPHEFMVIQSGTAEVVADGKHLADLGPGDFFGEIALLAEHRRTATVTATSELRIVVMHERDFRVMEDQMPDVAAKIRSVMADRREEHRTKTGEDA
jgi:CRP-like cAMP-binding protein